MDTVLGEFIDLAPACAHTASLKTVLECFGQEQCEQIVIIDEQQRPLGLLRLATLISDRAVIFDPAAVTPLSPWQRSTANLQECSIQELTTTKNLLRLEPLILLELQSSLNQFQPHLSHLQRHQYGLVDPAGRYQGLLDRLQLLQFLITHPIKSIAPTISTFAQVGGVGLQASEADDRSQLGSTPLSDLIKLIDQLPLPLMLQTSAGQVVSQNQTWQQQVGKLQDPQETRQAAAAWLRKTIDPDRPLNAWDQEPELIDSLNFCYGSDINSCVCVCPMKSGQDQVWKFLKIPLDVGFDPRDVRTGDQAGSSEDLAHWAAIGYCPLPAAQSSALFQLATLELAPHLPWQGQAETLPLRGTLWLIVAQDTTEQQQVAKELTAKNADLMQLNRLQNEFLASISHELKTPLTAILGLSSLLQDQMLGELNDRQIRYARMIHQGGRQLVLLVNDILDLTRMETGQLDLTLEIVGLENVCTSAYEQARQAHKNKAVDEITTSATSINQEPSFSLEIEPAIESLVADRLRLRQMLSNLLLNALEFTDASGKIGLKVEQWEGWIAFTVWDDGVGIPTHEQHLIFQKFQQLANPLTQQFEGTGLGLVLTQRLARLHGGEVTFTSIEGQGSQFTLLLPPNPTQINQGRDRALEITSLKSTSLKSTSLKPTPNRLVLVVEAVPQFLERLTRQLTDLGYRVVVARSGTEALEKVRRLQPAVVFINPVLPLLSGWDLLTLIKSESEIRHIPIVVTATSVEKTQAFHNGADGFISLPVQPEVLRQTLERLIDAEVSAPTMHPLSKLTVLHLFVDNTADSTVDSTPVLDSAALSGQATPSVLPVNLHTLLHPHHRRILEVDDLEQADLLARIWKPNVLLLDGRLTDPIAYLKRLSQCTFLAALPLVTLTLEITQAANQVGLTVFPCLADGNTAADRQSGAPSALLQVLQIATEVKWTPHILLVDLGALPDSIAETEWEGITTSTVSVDMPTEDMDRSTDVSADGLMTVSMQVRPETEWLQSTAQSLRIAGMSSSVTDSWSQVMHHLHHQSVDLLLLRTDQNQPHPSVLRVLQTLVQLEYKPPILVCQTEQAEATTDWLDQIEVVGDRTVPLEQGDQSEQATYMQLLRAIATQFLSPSLSIKDLLQQIDQNLRRP
jgi:signal transduction histidine kinase/CheY-like chemotaxis protein